MNLREIQEIIQKEGGKIVIVEQDKPQMVIMSFEEWKGRRPAENPPKARIQAGPPQSGEVSLGGEDLTIDDLPL